MMLVVGLVALMLGLLVPAISSFSSSYGRRGAVNVVMNTLEHARVKALETGGTVHVLFWRRDHPDRDAMMVLGEPPLGETDAVIYTRWKPLPGNVRFKTLANTVTGESLSGSDVDASDLTGIAADTDRLSAISFNSNGQVTYPGTGSLQLLLFEGIRDSSGAEARTGASQTMLEKITIARFTGRPRLEVSTVN